MKEEKICVLIPAYNCEKSIATVIASVLRHTPNVLVVNDGSTDATLSIISTQFENQVVLVSYPQNRGKGYALKKGFEKARELGYTAVITIDSDGQHSADDIPKFVRFIQENPKSLIVGARSFNHPNMPSGNLFANKFSNFWFTVQTANKLPDTQSGYRLYPIAEMKMLPITKRYEAEIELLVRSAWRGIPICSVPISVHYDPIEERVSHFRPKQDFSRISVLNSCLCILAIIYGYPSIFIHKLIRKLKRKP